MRLQSASCGTARWKRGIIPHCVNDPQPEGHMASYIRRRKFLATLGSAADVSFAKTTTPAARHATELTSRLCYG